MKWGISIIVALLLVAGSRDSHSKDLYFGGFNGTWEGAIRQAELDPSLSAQTNKSSENRYRFAINGTTIQVYYFSGNDWRELKPGEFQMISHKTNAIIYETDSADDVMDKTGTGGWVESQVYTMTHKDGDHLYVYRTRAVNNYLEAPDKSDARFFFIGFGEFSRVR